MSGRADRYPETRNPGRGAPAPPEGCLGPPSQVILGYGQPGEHPYLNNLDVQAFSPEAAAVTYVSDLVVGTD